MLAVGMAGKIGGKVPEFRGVLGADADVDADAKMCVCDCW